MTRTGKENFRAMSSASCQFAARQARRIGDHRQRAVAKNLVRHAREKHRVHAAGIGHETGAVAFQQLRNFSSFLLRRRPSSSFQFSFASLNGCAS